VTSGREGAAWHVGAVAAFALAGVLTMRPWLDPSVIPGNDFPGFAAEVEWTRVTLDRDGRLPMWMSDRFAGTTRFMSNLKEIATYPLATLYGAVQGTKLMFLLMRIVGAFGLADLRASPRLAGGGARRGVRVRVRRFPQISRNARRAPRSWRSRRR
jgi:hypothetical protein